MTTNPADLFQEPEQRMCFICGDYGLKERMGTIDISTEDEYYPAIRYVCRHHSEEQ